MTPKPFDLRQPLSFGDALFIAMLVTLTCGHWISALACAGAYLVAWRLSPRRPPEAPDAQPSLVPEQASHAPEQAPPGELL